MRVLLLVGLAVLGVACGGKVELSSGGDGGHGGGATTSSTSTSTGGGSSTNTTTTVTNTTTTVTSTTGTSIEAQVEQLCTSICTLAPEKGCSAGEPDCASECAAGYVEAEECKKDYLAMLICIEDEVEALCNGASVCEAELNAFEKCEGATPDDPPKPGEPPPSPPACDPSASCSGWAEGDSGASGCDCSVECQGETFRVVCESASGDGASCECYRGDNLVATCEEPGSGTCGVTKGCCAEAFFHYGPK